MPIRFLDPISLERCLALMAKDADRSMDLADASLVVAAIGKSHRAFRISDLVQRR